MPPDAAGHDQAAIRVYKLWEVLVEEFCQFHPEHADRTLAKCRDAAAGAAAAGDRVRSPDPSSADDDPENNAGCSAYYNAVHALGGDGQTALCLSGGGIRSAAFCLGVLQGLSQLGVLHTFHYLSTVSGGGYIGCWLTAWRSRTSTKAVLAGLRWPEYQGAKTDPRPQAITQLRRYTSYLSPVVGVLSPDTWTGVMLYLRNFILNLLVIVPGFAALLMGPKLVALGIFADVQAHQPVTSLVVIGFLLFATACAVLYAERPGWRAEYPSPKTGLKSWPTIGGIAGLLLASAVLATGMLPVVVGPAPTESREEERKLPDAIAELYPIVTEAAESARSSAREAANAAKEARDRADGLFPATGPQEKAASAAAAAAVAAAEAAAASSQAAQSAGEAAALLNPRSGGRRPVEALWCWWLIGGGAFLFAAVGGLRLLIYWLMRSYRVNRAGRAPMPGRSERGTSGIADAVTAPPTPGYKGWSGFEKLMEQYRKPVLIADLILALVLGGAAFGGLLTLGIWLVSGWDSAPNHVFAVLTLGPLWVMQSYLIGEMIYLGVTSRWEWSDMEREWLARTAAWATLGGLGYTALFAIVLFGPEVVAWVWSGSLGPAVTAAITLLSGAGSVLLGASPLTSPTGRKAHATRLPVTTILAIATPLFVLILAAFISTAVDNVLYDHALRAELAATAYPPMRRVGLTFLIFVVVSLGSARFVNVNRLSLFGIYRNRLNREFIGASDGHRKPDPWTDFDGGGDLRLARMWPAPDDRPILYPVINAALNIAGTKRSEWAERKAEPFVFTPKFCGAEAAGAKLGFRRTEHYANGVPLASAMTISGAAVSPNSGYSTMPGLSLLMTLFNARLGVWLGNPGENGNKTFSRLYPAFAWQPLLAEALALTNDQRAYVYLSDGGHFENLGAYEMIRRRCRFVVVIDAGADPDYRFEDLGNFVRKVSIDFGVRITFKHLDLEKRSDRTTSTGERRVEPASYAVGDIEYPECKDGVPRTGKLVYIKAGYHGSTEPADVRNYALAHPAFPHETTANQFFTESQFESYRALGEHIIRRLGTSWPGATSSFNSLAEFVTHTENVLDARAATSP